MSNDPLTAADLPELFKRQLDVRFPLAPVSAVARDRDISHGSLVAWLAGTRTPTPENIRDVLGKLDAPAALVDHALRLWAAAKGAA